MARPQRPQEYYDQIKDKFREERNLRLGYRPQEQISTLELVVILRNTLLIPMPRMFQAASRSMTKLRCCLSVVVFLL